jgi:SOS response regulatory protein OraA/RecX
MATITLSDILDDLRAADQALRKFEQRYWLSSDVFYDLYSQGLLDDGSHAEDFAEWAGHYKLKLKRESALKQLSRQRVEQLQRQATGDTIELAPQEPVLELA